MIENIIDRFQNDHYAPISFDLGFNIRKTVAKLPDSHHIWDIQAEKLSDDLATFRIKEALREMPVLHADENSLSNEYLLRASIVVSGFAHAYYYPEGYSDDSPLPDSVLIPLEEIAKRINKKFTDENSNKENEIYVGRTYLEDFLANWELNFSIKGSENITLDDIQIDKIKLLVPYFANREEFVSTVVTGPLMQARFAPAIKCIAEIEKELKEKSPNTKKIIIHLEKITNVLKDVNKAFMLMSPKLGTSSYVDQIIWPQTSPTIGKKAHRNEFPNTGADSSIFHVMDKFLNRTIYNSKMGQNIINRFNAVVESHQEFINEVDSVGERLFYFIKNQNNEDLNQSFSKLVLFYAGPGGFLDAHRKKAYGYLKMSFLAGRLATNGKEQGSANTTEDAKTGLTPWGRLNLFFLKGMEERIQVLQRLGINYQSHFKENSLENYSTNSREFSRYSISNLSQDSKVIGVYRDKVFDLTKISQTHPGGDRIIRSLAGSDITIELEQAHHFDLKKVTSLLKKYYIGNVKKNTLNRKANSTIDDWTKTLFLMSAVQNNIKNIWFFDKSRVGDGKRYMPFQFVMKTIDIIFGIDGYFDSLLKSINSDLMTKYRDKTMPYFSEAFSKEIKFHEIGQLAMSLGKDEITARKISTSSDTEINKLYIYTLYSNIICKTLNLLNKLKEEIIKELDNISEMDEESFSDELCKTSNEKLNSLILSSVNDLILSIDTPEMLNSSKPPRNYLNTTFIYSLTNKLNANVVLGALSSFSLVMLMATNKNNIKVGAGLTLSASVSLLGLSLSRNGFFNRTHSSQENNIEERENSFSPTKR